jgi:hypothetical protein
MAFPGNYSFSYYRGDTFEFRVYPKTSSGSVFDLSGYNKTSGARFTISTARGSQGFDNQIAATALISEDETYIQCSIVPEVGILLDPIATYVYDIEITKTDTSSGSEVTQTYTLLTGSITVTDHITGATAPEEEEV